MTQNFDSIRDIYIKNTDTMNNYNEINNLNNYLGGLNSTELQQMNTYNDIIRSKLLKLKQEYLLNDYGIQEYGMRTNIMLYTIMATAGILVALAAYRTNNNMSGQYFGYTCLATGILYLLVVLTIVINNRNRRKYDWNTYYFAVKKV